MKNFIYVFVHFSIQYRLILVVKMSAVKLSIMFVVYFTSTRLILRKQKKFPNFLFFFICVNKD